MEPQRSLKVLLADVPEPDAIEIAAALESASWTVHTAGPPAATASKRR
jgi:hypothetical protein